MIRANTNVQFQDRSNFSFSGYILCDLSSYCDFYLPRQAWRDLQNLSQEEAMEQYIDKLDDVAPDWQEDSKVSFDFATSQMKINGTGS